VTEQPLASKQPLVFGTEGYDYLARKICDIDGFQAGRQERVIFPDGERYMRILDNVDYRDVVLVGGTISDTDTLEIFDLACALVKYGAQSLAMVIPYFGYSTMERAVKDGEVVTAKNRARLLSAVPLAKFGNRVVFLDLHADGLPEYFEGEVTTAHLHARSFVRKAAAQLSDGDFVLGCTDAGRAKWVQTLAQDLGVSASFVMKRRVDGGTTELIAVSAHVQDRDVIIYDDMIRTGGSLLTAAKAYLDAGARSTSAIATHGVLPGDSLQELANSGLFTKIICTDSHPRARLLQNNFLQVESIADLLAQYLLTGVME
jgi:ribose-phosphate pyrophosphokinase